MRICSKLCPFLKRSGIFLPNYSYVSVFEAANFFYIFLSFYFIIVLSVNRVSRLVLCACIWVTFFQGCHTVEWIDKTFFLFLVQIEAKRGGLDMLSSKDISFRYLVESFPRLLLLPLESQMNTILKFFENKGISRGCVRNILLTFPPIMFYKVEVIKTRMLVFKEVMIFTAN